MGQPGGQLAEGTGPKCPGSMPSSIPRGLGSASRVAKGSVTDPYGGSSAVGPCAE